MVDKVKPRRGSLAYRPRKRSRTQNPSPYWAPDENKRVLGLAGYKVGMTHVAYVDQSESPTKGKEIVSAATVVEVPPLLVYGARCYKKGGSAGDILCDDEKILKLARAKKKAKEIKTDELTDVRLLVMMQPSKTQMGKKHIEKCEIGCGGKDVNEKLDYAKSLLGKELKASEIFKPGEYVDVIAVTRGKGWQGPVKRFGVKIQRRKATGKRRHVGTLGPFHPAYILYTAPQAGQMGYHRRTEINKLILKIGEKPEEINPAGGFPRYGLVKNDFLLVKGSIAGPAKRLVKIRLAVRIPSPAKEPALSYVSLEPR